MPSTQPTVTAANEEPFALEHFEGASFRFSLTPEFSEMRAPKKGKQNAPVLDHQKELVKLLNSFSGRHSH